MLTLVCRCQTICALLADIDKLMSTPDLTEEQNESLAKHCEKYCEIFPILFPKVNMTQKNNILSCLMPKQIREMYENKMSTSKKKFQPTQ